MPESHPATRSRPAKTRALPAEPMVFLNPVSIDKILYGHLLPVFRFEAYNAYHTLTRCHIDTIFFDGNDCPRSTTCPLKTCGLGDHYPFSVECGPRAGRRGESPYEIIYFARGTGKVYSAVIFPYLGRLARGRPILLCAAHTSRGNPVHAVDQRLRTNLLQPQGKFTGSLVRANINGDLPDNLTAVNNPVEKKNRYASAGLAIYNCPLDGGCATIPGKQGGVDID